MTTKVKVAPHSKESEMMVLGCMLTSINSLNIAADSLSDSDFYFTEHKLVFQVLRTAYKQDKPADIHLVCEELKRIDKLDAVGGASYVTTLAQYAGTSAYIEEYVGLVKAKAILRRMIFAAQDIEKTALDEPDDVHSVLDEAQQRFFQISQSANPDAGYMIADILAGIKGESNQPFLKELEERQERYQTRGPEETGITGIPTHFLDLDRLTNGLNKSHMIILAARPAMGKTALAINIAENVCFKENKPVGIFSLEMSAEQLVQRVVSSQSGVASEKIKTGALNGTEYQRVVASVHEMQKHTMLIDDQPGIKITDLRARARRMKEVHDISLIVVDYLQLLSGSGSSRSNESRQIEISEISRMLKNLARELNIPVLCLSQLSRRVEERQGHRPMMSDLRESGCLSGDALITNAKTGEQFTIQELAERKEELLPMPVHAVNGERKMGVYQMTKAFYSGRKKTYTLKTRSGRVIRASANHPFLKLDGWSRLDQLKVGDSVGLPRELNCSASRNPMSDNELILLAHLLGDGCILPNQPYHYTNEDPKNIECVKNTAKELFSIEGRIVPQKGYFHIYLSSPYHLTHRKKHPITHWYARLGIDRARSGQKRLPEALFSSSPDKIALFLHHIWATDGSITWKKLKGRKPSASIYYCSTSERLIRQIQHLLLRLGIPSTFRTVPQGNYSPSYQVHIMSAPNQKRFLETVGCHGKRGDIIPELLTALGDIDPNPNNDVIPKEAWLLFVKPEKEKIGYSWRKLSAELGMSYCGSTLMKSGISRERMHRLSHALENSTLLLQLAKCDVHWDTIIGIEEGEEEDVYDATVDEVHNFVANDIIVHNSLEQDSDIVMFLLRREYYDPMDKPGMAEVIVAKNRHGGVGTVNLTFRKEFTQFANYTPAPEESY